MSLAPSGTIGLDVFAWLRRLSEIQQDEPIIPAKDRLSGPDEVSLLGGFPSWDQAAFHLLKMQSHGRCSSAHVAVGYCFYDLLMIGKAVMICRRVSVIRTQASPHNGPPYSIQNVE